MTDRAPERIWLEQFYAPFGETYWSQAASSRGRIEYIRADLAPSPSALSVECEEVTSHAAYNRKVASLIERQGREIAELKAKLERSQERWKASVEIGVKAERELAEARAATIEECAKVVDCFAGYAMDRKQEFSDKDISRAIRALASRNPADGERR